MNIDQNGSLILMETELEYVSGGAQYSPNGQIFNAGMEMVAEGKDMMKSGSTVGSFFGLAQTTIGGWYLAIGGTADWLGSLF